MPERGFDRPQGMVGLRDRGVEPGHDGVAHEFIDRAFFRQHGICGQFSGTVEHSHQFFR